MNYDHHYHAGNAADVVKHVILVAIIQALQQKEKGYCYLDTHAGRGMYLLSCEDSTLEYKSGVAKLKSFNASVEAPAIAQYLNIVNTCNKKTPKHKITYPGSPWIVAELARAQDRSILTEVVPEYLAVLEYLLAKKPGVMIHAMDGYQALKIFLPPKEKRGLVLIDPPYEHKQEWQQVVDGLAEAYRRWSTGIYMIWYPIKNQHQIKHFYRQMQATTIRKILKIEFYWLPADVDMRLNGCGLLVVNPPWSLQKTLNSLLSWLGKQLSSDNKIRSKVEWLVPE